MTGYALHPGALGDIEQIWEYIFEDNPDAPTAWSPRFLRPAAP
jgi:plasmid stabilization system protein ParE